MYLRVRVCTRVFRVLYFLAQDDAPDSCCLYSTLVPFIREPLEAMKWVLRVFTVTVGSHASARFLRTEKETRGCMSTSPRLHTRLTIPPCNHVCP